MTYGYLKAHRLLEFQKAEASLGQKSFEERDSKFAKSDETYLLVPKDQ